MTFTPQELVAVTAMQKLAKEYNDGPYQHFSGWLADYQLPEPEPCRDCATNRDAIKHNYPWVPCSKHPTSEPEKKQWVPKLGQRYFIPDIHSEELTYDSRWAAHDKRDSRRLELGLVCQTEEEAREMAMKMLAAIKK